MRSTEYTGGFWHLFDRVTAPGRVLTAEERLWRSRVLEAAQALARGDYGPARAVLAEA